MKRYFLTLLVFSVVLLVGCAPNFTSCSSNLPFTGQVDVKLNVKGEPAENVAGVLDYKQNDIDEARQKLINELPNAKVKKYTNSEESIKSLPFLILTKARAEDLKILEESDLVEFFYSDEPHELDRGLYGRPEFGYPCFKWSYTKTYGYRLGDPDWGANAKKFEPAQIYQIYKSNGRNIPKDIMEEWNKYAGKNQTKK